MAKVNRATFQSTTDDFIDRVAPFDSDPLIQKSEHKEILSDLLGDSAQFSIATESSINSPSAAFSVDFDTIDQYTIDTTGVGTTAFTITLQNLDENRTGLLVINKKSNDTFTFANGDLVQIIGSIEDQEGQTEIKFVVKKFAGVGTFVVYPADDFVNTWTKISDVNTADTDMTSNAYYRKFNGKVEFKGNLVVDALTAVPLFNAFTLPAAFRPDVQRVVVISRSGAIIEQLTIPTSGTVTLQNADTTYYLDNVSFYILET